MLNLTFLKNNLVAAINIAMKAVPTRTSLPILEWFLFDAREVLVPSPPYAAEMSTSH